MSKSPRYPGPLTLAEAKSKLVLTPLEDSRFHRDGPRANVEYRDLGLADASDGRISGKHIRAIQPFPRTVTSTPRKKGRCINWVFGLEKCW